MSELAKLEGLAIGLEQRGEKSAAQQVRWAVIEIERLRTLVRAAYWEGADPDISWDTSETRCALEGK